MNFILFSFREFHKLQEAEVAQKIAISIEEYKRLELGIEKIDTEIATKLSRVFDAPPNLFLLTASDTHSSIVYTQCHFENSNGYVNHLYYESPDLIRAKEETISVLKDEVRQLREENKSLFLKLLEI